MIKFPVEHEVIERLNPALKSIGAYTVAGGQSAAVKLNQNENPFDLPSELKLEILNAFFKEEWNRYPDIFPTAAIARYAKHLGVPPECVMGGNGSNELIYTIFLATVWRGVSVLIPTPMFSLYEKVATLLQAEVIKVAMKDDLSYDVDGIIEEALRSKPNLIVLTSPNNPTSKSIAFSDLRRIVEETECLVLIDEAYIEFSREQSALSLIYDYGNVVILRTFSKAFAGAGLRIGFAISNPRLMSELLKPKIPFASGRLMELATIALLDHYELIEREVKHILAERERLWAEMKTATSYTVHESDANFFVVETPTPKALFSALQKEGILVRDVSSYPLMTRCVRIGIGRPEENDRLLAALKSYDVSGGL